MATTVYATHKILTLDPALPLATHVAVCDGRIAAVGGMAQMRALGSFELDETFVDHVLIPGLVEGHCHLKEGDMWRMPYLGWFERKDPRGKVWLGLRSMHAVVERLRTVDAEMQAHGELPDKPLVAWGFDPIYFGGERMTVEHLDRVSIIRPIVISHANGHLMNVNSATMRLAGITRETNIEGIVRFPNGEPNGELHEPAAMFPVVRKIPNAGLLNPISEEGMANFAAIARQHGVTTATDMVNSLGEAECRLLEATCAADDYCVRLLPAFQAFHGALRAQKGAEYVKRLMERNTDRLRYGLVKFLLDGSIQGFTARLRPPGYHNGAPNGIWVTAPSQYEADLEAYHQAGLVLHTHTNGDEASEVAITAAERVQARHPRTAHRHTLQHGQMIDAPQFARLAALGMGANLFTNHVWYWGDQHHDTTLGPARAKRLDACASALYAGVPLAIHSDAPVTPLAPLFTAWCAVNRITPSGRVLGKQERITVSQALHAITSGAAWTLGMEHEIGSISVGKRADFCVLKDDPLEVDPMQLKDIPVWGTVLSGRVFQASA
jgi:predicted amidohydrolase YtcJ